jgi:hypothetical protein
LGISKHTNRLRFLVKVQLFKQPTTFVEEGIREKTPSSPEISFPAKAPHNIQTPVSFNIQASRMSTLNVTLTNIETHARSTKIASGTPYRNKNRPQGANRNPELHPQKIFSALILTIPSLS